MGYLKGDRLQALCSSLSHTEMVKFETGVEVTPGTANRTG